MRSDTENMDRLLVIIPAFNEALNIPMVVRDLTEKCPFADYVIVNDGSTDKTRKVCKEQGLNMLDLPVNLGLAGAFRSGIKYANFYDYDYALQLDGDGQHCPEYISALLDCMKETDSDIVIGSRFKTERKPLTLRMVGSQMITYAIWITTGGKYIGDVTSGMRLFNKKMIKLFGYNVHYRPEPDSLAYLVRKGVKIEEVQVKMRERLDGVSYLNPINSMSYMIHVLFNIYFLQWFRKE